MTKWARYNPPEGNELRADDQGFIVHLAGPRLRPSEVVVDRVDGGRPFLAGGELERKGQLQTIGSRW